jgi:hypothetical protein
MKMKKLERERERERNSNRPSPLLEPPNPVHRPKQHSQHTRNGCQNLRQQKQIQAFVHSLRLSLILLGEQEIQHKHEKKNVWVQLQCCKI